MLLEILNNRIKNNLDFLFITNLTTAKVSRSFKDKATPVSQFIHSYRQEQNPKYVSAFTRYQTALSILIQLKFDQTILNVEVLGMVLL